MSIVRLLVLLAGPLLASACRAAAPAPSAQQTPVSTAPAPLHWIFLTTGRSLEGVEAEEVERMQSEHLANFARLHAEGRLLSAGPLRDPAGILRGIVVMRARDATDLAEMFLPDPYVQLGFLRVEASAVSFPAGALESNVDPEHLEEWRLVVLSRREALGPDSALDEETAAFLQGALGPEGLRLIAMLEGDPGGRRAVLITAERDGELLTDFVARIPTVEAGKDEAHAMPLYLSAGALR